jgi:hypothetical protein
MPSPVPPPTLDELIEIAGFQPTYLDVKRKVPPPTKPKPSSPFGTRAIATTTTPWPEAATLALKKNFPKAISKFTPYRGVVVDPPQLPKVGLPPPKKKAE